VEQIFALDDITQAAKAGAGSGRNGKVLLRP
jgi:hypothetical protein